MGTVVSLHRRGGQEPPRQRPPKGRTSRALLLTPEEKRNLYTSLQNLRRTFGSWRRLSEAMGGVSLFALQKAAVHGSPALALAAARAGRTTVEAILSGAITDAGRCPSCGSTLTQRAAGGGR